ncbi:MAG: hypothetical protein QOE39_3280 [Bradyrhizobium sp.]|jgi:hypothetical protein|nr:hypothetical protein [Bradyrhizobium sp.]
MTMLIHTPRSAATARIAWRGFVLFLARLRRFINRLVAAAIARRERQAMFVVPRNLNDQDRS